MADDECTRNVIAASQAEHQGIELDRAGNSIAAVQKYEECVQSLTRAIAAAGNHPEDRPKLEQHRQEIMNRIQHLRSLGGKPATIPVENQIKAVQLGMSAMNTATQATSQAGGVKTLAGAAAVGAVGGAVVLGGIVGAPLAIIGGAGAAAYMATRSDGAGDVARSAGNASAAAASKAKELNEQHRITTKVVEGTKSAVGAVRETDQQYGISTKIGAGLSAAAGKAQEVNQQHDITGKVATGVTAGFNGLAGLLSGRGGSGSGNAPRK